MIRLATLAARLGAAAAMSAALLAHVPPALAAPAPEAERRFDLSVNNAPAAQVFMQMAANTPYNVLVSPEVAGNVSITLKNTTLPEAMEAMRELFGYDFRITGNRIFVQPNTVQTRLFKVSYLPGRRQGASDLRVSSSSITQSGAGNSNGSNGSSSGSSSGNNGSSGSTPRQDDSAHVRTTSDADFWREVNSSLNALVGAANGRSVVLNPSAGVVVVKATPNELRQVEQYLKAVQLSIERQVMLEAKIVEVSLSKDAQAGVNWGAFGKIFGNVTAALGVSAPNVTLQTAGQLISGDTTVVTGQPGGVQNGATGRGFYGLALQASNFAALINFLQTQGDVQVLSSPRIATLNNQKAVLKVGSDELFVTGVTSNTTSTGTSSVSSPTLTLTPFFSGIVLDVTPQIDEDGQVMLHVHPAISTVVEKQKNVDLGSLGNFRLPLATSTVNETDSIVRVRDGQFVAIGGLMVQQSSDERTGVPGVQDVPVLGGLFRQSAKVSTKRELVILMKPTVIRDGGWPEAQMPGATAGGN
ncbi:pilus (MSHA type) biogenesis protein MshL [Ideonella sp. BN130291]|uniref:pilus (MSHA type) biogenesis protein MshL n=1 Tax=Ideonella sp. BN130291 TaxID=3112940 RepID=UPI002E26635B|nr:pilus (MSHA type) biogenesis protein MshL [Ideonella sp. BN130291]